MTDSIRYNDSPKLARVKWLDSFKGLLALSVILGHAMQMGLGIEVVKSDYIWNIIYSVHMPAFVAVSGFLAFNKAGKLSIVNYIKKRSLQLIVPFAIWTLLFLFCRGRLTSENLWNSIYHPDSAYWFLYSLFFICCIFELVVLLSRLLKISEVVLLLISSAVMMLIMIKMNIKIFGYQLISYYFFFYSLGYIIRKFDWIIMNKYWMATICTLWLVMAYFWRIDEPPVFLKGIPYVTESILLYGNRFAVALIGVFALFSLASKFLGEFQNKFVLWIGFYSLGIYTAQLLYSHLVSDSIYYLFSESTEFCMVLLDFIVITVLSVITIKICSNYKVLSKLFLGKF